MFQLKIIAWKKLLHSLTNFLLYLPVIQYLREYTFYVYNLNFFMSKFTWKLNSYGLENI